MELSVKQRVNNGVYFLDNYAPNWREKISIEKLDMSHPDYCIMGQIGWPKRDEYSNFAAIRFCSVSELCGFLNDGEATYDKLQKEWIKILTKA